MNESTDTSGIVYNEHAEAIPWPAPPMPRELVYDLNILRRPAVPVKKVREGLEIGRRLVGVLERLNKHAKRKNSRSDAIQKGVAPSLDSGIGLAAPQIGITKRVFVFRSCGIWRTVVNPKLISWTDDSFCHIEGCLSFPGIQASVSRFKWVSVGADNLTHPLSIGTDRDIIDVLITDLNEFTCLQHEYQHVLGITITDHSDPNFPSKNPNEWEAYAATRPVEIK